MNKFFFSALLRCFCASQCSSAGQDLNLLIRKEATTSVPAAEQMYRELHQNPELSLQEFKTAEKMALALEKMGFDVTKGVGGNGVVGVFRNGTGPVVMLRTDMDALPVRETTGVSWASTVTVTTTAEWRHL